MLRNRTSVIDAKRDLIKAGFKVDGDDDSWHDALEDLNDARIAGAVRTLKKTGEYKNIRASHVVKAAGETSFGGAGQSDIKIEGLQMWKDNMGRDYTWFPELGSRYNNREQHQNILRAEAEASLNTGE